MHIFIYIYIFTNIIRHTYMHIYIYTCIITYTYTHIRICIYAVVWQAYEHFHSWYQSAGSHAGRPAFFSDSFGKKSEILSSDWHLWEWMVDMLKLFVLMTFLDIFNMNISVFWPVFSMVCIFSICKKSRLAWLSWGWATFGWCMGTSGIGVWW